MAKMLLYAMNYGVTVEGGVWPAAVMGKADDVGIFDDVNALPNVPALRGDVVMMIDNSLTVNHLKQTGYGDLKQYEEDEGKTFLSKLNVDEIDGRIIEINAKRNEVKIKDEDDNQEIYTLLNDIDVNTLLGLDVTVWANDDEEIFFIDYDMNQFKKDIIDADVEDADFDGSDLTEIDLKLADDTFDVSEDVTVYVDGKKSNWKNQPYKQPKGRCLWDLRL
jgi:hypothetical protein